MQTHTFRRSAAGSHASFCNRPDGHNRHCCHAGASPPETMRLAISVLLVPVVVYRMQRMQRQLDRADPSPPGSSSVHPGNPNPYAAKTCHLIDADATLVAR